MAELMLLSNSYAPGRGALEHALDALGDLLTGYREVLFLPYAGDDFDRYTALMETALAPLGVRVIAAHREGDRLPDAEAVFVGGGNSFRLLRAVARGGGLTALAERVRAGLPYVGVSAGANLAAPTIRTTNDMPIVEPPGLAALGLVPFQLNPHYPVDEEGRRIRDGRLGEFLAENDVPVLGLCEGSWLRVSGDRAVFDGVAGGRLLRRDAPPRDVQPGDDLSPLLGTGPVYDTPAATPG